MTTGGVAQPNADVEALAAAVDACFDAPVSCLATDELSDRLVLLAQITAKLDALRVEATIAAEVGEVGQLTDQRNTANHLASRVNVDPAAVRADQRIGQWLSDLPILAAAYRSGRIHTEHVDALRRADNGRVHAQLVADQKQFVEWFTTCHFRDLRLIIGRWLLGADPDGAEPVEHQRRLGLSITVMPDGTGKLVGVLDPLQTAALRTAVNAEAQAIRRQHKQAGTVSTGRRRMLDALLNLVGRGDVRQGRAFARPRVNIVLSQQVYEGTLNWLADPANNSLPETDSFDIDKKCQLIDGTPIHPLYALAATATATFRRLVYSARGRPLDVSFSSRSFPDWMRDVTLVTSNGLCANPVCDAPFEWLHADHVLPYSHNGKTSLGNGRPVCEADNLWRGNDTSRGRWTPAPAFI